jgi:hypothetical protein
LSRNSPIIPTSAHSSSILSSSWWRSELSISVSTDFCRELKSDLHLSADRLGTLSVPVSQNPVRIPFACQTISNIIKNKLKKKHTTVLTRMSTLTEIVLWKFFNQLEGLFAVTIVEVNTCVLENLWNEILVLALNEKCFSKMCCPMMLLTDDKSGNWR